MASSCSWARLQGVPQRPACSVPAPAPCSPPFHCSSPVGPARTPERSWTLGTGGQSRMARVCACVCVCVCARTSMRASEHEPRCLETVFSASSYKVSQLNPVPGFSGWVSLKASLPVGLVLSWGVAVDPHPTGPLSPSWSASAPPTTTAARTRPSSCVWSPRSCTTRRMAPPASPVRRPRWVRRALRPRDWLPPSRVAAHHHPCAAASRASQPPACPVRLLCHSSLTLGVSGTKVGNGGCRRPWAVGRGVAGHPGPRPCPQACS